MAYQSREIYSKGARSDEIPFVETNAELENIAQQVRVLFNGMEPQAKLALGYDKGDTPYDQHSGVINLDEKLDK